MNLRRLTYFVKIVDVGSLTQAPEVGPEARALVRRPSFKRSAGCHA